MKAIALIIVVATYVMLSCTNNTSDPAPCAVPEAPNYFNDVYPIIDRTCAIPTCHVNGSLYGNFKNADEVKKVADDGKLKFMIETRQMPAGTTKGSLFLTDCEINRIIKWTKNGALMN